MRKISIAIDGPCASGKSTIAKILSTKLGFIYIDTGAMYRAYTLAVINAGIDPKNEEQSNKLIGKVDISFDDKNRVTLNGNDVSNRVRENDVADNVSYIASYKEIRLFLVELQRKLAMNTSVIMDGRDIGTYVLPKADLKIFQIADANERANRRYLENLEKGRKSTFEECLENINKRDFIDSNRAFAPLHPAEDSIQIDTTKMTISDVVNKILELINEKGLDK